MQTFISTGCIPQSHSREPIEFIAEYIFKSGIKFIELTSTSSHSEFNKNVIFDLNHAGACFLIHNYFPPQIEDFVLNLSSDNNLIRTKTLNLVNQAVSLAKEFGVLLYSVHAGCAYDQLPVMCENGLFQRIDDSYCKESIFYNNLDLLSKRLPHGFRLAIENGVPMNGCHLCSPVHFNTFFNFCSTHPNIGMLLDIGHLKLSAYNLGFDMVQALDSIATNYHHHIFEFHVSQNNGIQDEHEPCTHDSYEIIFLHKNKKLWPDVPVVMEWHNCLDNEIIDRYTIIVDILQ